MGADKEATLTARADSLERIFSINLTGKAFETKATAKPGLNKEYLQEKLPNIVGALAIGAGGRLTAESAKWLLGPVGAAAAFSAGFFQSTGRAMLETRDEFAISSPMHEETPTFNRSKKLSGNLKSAAGLLVGRGGEVKAGQMAVRTLDKGLSFLGGKLRHKLDSIVQENDPNQLSLFSSSSGLLEKMLSEIDKPATNTLDNVENVLTEYQKELESKSSNQNEITASLGFLTIDMVGILASHKTTGYFQEFDVFKQAGRLTSMTPEERLEVCEKIDRLGLLLLDTAKNYISVLQSNNPEDADFLISFLALKDAQVSTYAVISTITYVANRGLAGGFKSLLSFEAADLLIGGFKKLAGAKEVVADLKPATPTLRPSATATISPTEMPATPTPEATAILQPTATPTATVETPPPPAKVPGLPPPLVQPPPATPPLTPPAVETPPSTNIITTVRQTIKPGETMGEILQEKIQAPRSLLWGHGADTGAFWGMQTRNLFSADLNPGLVKKMAAIAKSQKGLAKTAFEELGAYGSGISQEELNKLIQAAASGDETAIAKLKAINGCLPSGVSLKFNDSTLRTLKALVLTHKELLAARK